MDVLGLVNSNNTDLYTETVKKCLENRVLILNQDIDDDIIESFIINILNWNAEDMYVPEESRTPIKIIINSCGGDLFVGMGLVDAIMQSKTKIVCIGIGLVASAAFHIFISADERIAFQNTILLMHDGSIEISNSTSKARDTMQFFENMEKRTKAHVLSRTSMQEDYYDKHYEQELYMFSDEAKALGCVDKIVGTDVNLDYILR